MRTKRFLILTVVVVLALALAGCFKMEVTIALEEDENWTATTRIAYDEELMTEMAGDMGGETDMGDVETDMDDSVNELEEEFGDQIEVSWTTYDPEDEGWVGYEMVVSGQGYDLLNEVMFENEAGISVDDDGNVVFDISSVSGMEDITGEMGGEDEFDQMASLFDMEVIFAVEGADIVDANGEISEDGNRVEWVNTAGPFTATVTPPGAGGRGLLSCAGLGTGIFSVGMFLMLSKRKKDNILDAHN